MIFSTMNVKVLINQVWIKSYLAELIMYTNLMLKYSEVGIFFCSTDKQHILKGREKRRKET